MMVSMMTKTVTIQVAFIGSSRLSCGVVTSIFPGAPMNVN
jgi:hypothetical protein